MLLRFVQWFIVRNINYYLSWLLKLCNSLRSQEWRTYWRRLPLNWVKFDFKRNLSGFTSENKHIDRLKYNQVQCFKEISSTIHIILSRKGNTGLII